MEKKKLVIIIAAVLAAAAVIGIVVWSAGAPARARQEAMDEITAYRKGQTSFLTHRVAEMADDEEFAEFMVDKIENALNSCFKYDSFASLRAFLYDLDNCGYRSEYVKEEFSEMFYDLDTFAEKARMAGALAADEDLDLHASEYYMENIKLNSDAIQAHINEYGEQKINFEDTDDSYYADPSRRRDSYCEYGIYGTYKEYKYTYYGDFRVGKYSGYTVKSVNDLTSVPISGTEIDFCGATLSDMSEIPDPEDCILSGDYLFVSLGDTVRAYYLETGTFTLIVK